MLKVIVSYPEREEERTIMDRMTSGPLSPVRPVVDPAMILRARNIVSDIYVDDKVKEYVLDLILASRNPEAKGMEELQQLIAYGASPRAGIFLISAARANAFHSGRSYVTPEDIKQLAPDVLRHRIIVTYEAEAEEITPDNIVQTILNHVDVP